MPALEFLLLAALTGAVVLVVWRTAPLRTIALVVAGAAIVLFAGVAFAQHRWQAIPLLVFGALLLSVTWRRRSVPLPHPFAVVAILTLAVASYAPLYLFPVSPLPAPEGPYPVGTRQFDVHDANRGRQLQVIAWYPAVTTPAAKRRPYFSDREVEELAPSIAKNFGYPDFLLSHLGWLPTNSYTDARIASGKFPLVIFSHGYWSYAAQNTSLMEALASHGYIVLSLAHQQDSADIRFTDGTFMPTLAYVPRPGDDGPTPAEEAFFNGDTHDVRVGAVQACFAGMVDQRIGHSLRTWRDDVIALITLLERADVPAPARDIVSAADFSRLALGGMSFGGSVSASVCNTDERCKAAINLDGQEYDVRLFNRNSRVPVLMLSSDWVRYRIGSRSADSGFTSNDYFYEELASAGKNPGIWRVRLAGTRHLGFTDLIFTMRQPLRGHYFGALDRTEAIVAVNDVALTFLNSYLRADRNASVEAAIARHPALIRRDAGGVRRWSQARPAQPD